MVEYESLSSAVYHKHHDLYNCKISLANASTLIIVHTLRETDPDDKEDNELEVVRTWNIVQHYYYPAACFKLYSFWHLPVALFIEPEPQHVERKQLV